MFAPANDPQNTSSQNARTYSPTLAAVQTDLKPDVLTKIKAAKALAASLYEP